jgi:hypothetical protein
VYIVHLENCLKEKEEERGYRGYMSKVLRSVKCTGNSLFINASLIDIQVKHDFRVF